MVSVYQAFPIHVYESCFFFAINGSSIFFKILHLLLLSVKSTRDVAVLMSNLWTLLLPAYHFIFHIFPFPKPCCHDFILTIYLDVFNIDFFIHYNGYIFFPHVQCSFYWLGTFGGSFSEESEVDNCIILHSQTCVSSFSSPSSSFLMYS